MKRRHEVMAHAALRSRWQMSADRVLRRLARAAGVAVGYRDAWNRECRASPETLRAILGAMGLAAQTPADAAATKAWLEANAWSEVLPAAVVTVVGETAIVPIVCEAASIDPLRWRLRLEGGERQEGTIELGALAVLAQRREGRRRLLRLALPAGSRLPTGYHRLVVTLDGRDAETTLIVAPARCHLPAALGEDGRCWAVTAPLYALRSERNWGIGDFSDLTTLSVGAARWGAHAVGINPVHALFPVEPRHISPYAPSSRLFLNPLYIDVEAVPEFAQITPPAPEARAALAHARGGDLVDHERVAALKEPVFDALYDVFAVRHLGAAPTERGAEFRRFQRQAGRALETYAAFATLHEHMYGERRCFAWRDWPAALRDAASVEVARFADARRARLERHQYLQWEADRQLGVAARRATEASLAIGLYRDLAVGVDPNGADAWADPTATITDASVGAPPDMLNMKGQDWGLAPINPRALQRDAHTPFVAALRANIRHAGVLRIDHAMSLMRLYWVPRGASPTEGTYVSYPFADLRRVLALESERQRCAVIGEDLGTVPDGFRATMAASGVLSYRVLLFEREADGRFLPPGAYPTLAAAAFTTHDVATLRGFWLGRDMEWRRRLDLYPTPEMGEVDRRDRRRDRRSLLEALIGAGVLPADAAERVLPSDDAPIYGPELAEAVGRFLARSPARLVLMQIEDLLGEIEQANIPGTIDAHPNWRRKLSLSLDQIMSDPGVARIAAALAAARTAP
jgi:4-alpha-glucanotransferase